MRIERVCLRSRQSINQLVYNKHVLALGARVNEG